MDYKIITIEEDEGIISEHVLITHKDGSFESFPVTDSNPRYQQFLLELENTEEE
jgi:hypothetical protein